MGTSVHPSDHALPGGLPRRCRWLVLARFAYFSVLARFGHRREEPVRAPLRGFVVGATVAAIAARRAAVRAAAAHAHAVHPGARRRHRHGGAGGRLLRPDHPRQHRQRARQPRGGCCACASRRSSGRGARSASRPPPTTSTTAAPGAPTATLQPLAPEPGGTFRLAPGRPTAAGARSGCCRGAARRCRCRCGRSGCGCACRRSARDRGGAVALYHVPRGDAALRRRPGRRAGARRPAAARARRRRRSRASTAAAVTPRIAALAAQAMGQGSDATSARSGWSTTWRRATPTPRDFVGRSGQLALEDFLFRTRRGHCEFFATAMVVMLRSQGIPARFVTGFLGGEENAFEGYYVVRQSNAHAWVEAWFPDRGWQVFDPTPASGRPGAVERDLPLLFERGVGLRAVPLGPLRAHLRLLRPAAAAAAGALGMAVVLADLPAQPRRAGRRPSPTVETLPGGPVAPGTEAWSWERWRMPVAIAFAVVALTGRGRAVVATPPPPAYGDGELPAAAGTAGAQRPAGARLAGAVAASCGRRAAASRRRAGPTVEVGGSVPARELRGRDAGGRGSRLRSGFVARSGAGAEEGWLRLVRLAGGRGPPVVAWRRLVAGRRSLRDREASLQGTLASEVCGPGALACRRARGTTAAFDRVLMRPSEALPRRLPIP